MIPNQNDYMVTTDGGASIYKNSVMTSELRWKI